MWHGPGLFRVETRTVYTWGSAPRGQGSAPRGAQTYHKSARFVPSAHSDP